MSDRLKPVMSMITTDECIYHTVVNGSFAEVIIKYACSNDEVRKLLVRKVEEALSDLYIDYDVEPDST